jgi:pyruvate dehydrogenase E2 component (dihydrolipoamide acetyltransferase)
VKWTGDAEDPIRQREAAAPRSSSATPEGRLVKPSAMRRIIAERMLASKRETAQAYMAASVDATRLLETKDRLAGAVEKKAGVHLTVTDLLLKIAATAVSSHPEVNTRWAPEGILFLDAVHVGMAMSLDDGLVVPVIRDAGRKTLVEIARARAQIVERGKAGRLTPDEMKGSTVTLSSLGMFGVEEFTAILNPPESAILAVGAILDRPVVIDKQIVARPVMKVTLSYDHRVIDGAAAARFLNTFRELVEDPGSVVT